MKILNKIMVAAASLLAMTACVDKEVELQYFPNADVDFTYNVDGDEYTLDFYVVSTIQFNNTSVKDGAITWDFGDGTTSNEPNPTHKYAQAGLYKVTLTVGDAGSRTYPLMIYDIAPVLTVDTQSTEIVQFDLTTLTFALELPNPDNLSVKYVWHFPEGTMDEQGNPVTEFIGYSDENGNVDYPAPVKFKNIGSQRVEISTWFDVAEGGENRRLSDTYLNVQVGCSEPAPTLYYAQRSGNIKALKLLNNVPEGTKVYPFDMGVATGATVFNLVYADVASTDEDGNASTTGWIYILDAGKQYYYINDEDGVLGDGQITAMRTDGTGVNTVISNIGGPAFNDFFIGCAYNGYLYYSDRNTGISMISLTARGEVQGKNSNNNRDSYVMTNNTFPYYGRGISYGAITNGLYRDSKGVWWQGKKYNGLGIFRYKDTDVYATQADAEKQPIPYPIVLSDVKTSTFAVDEKRQALYTYRTSTPTAFMALPLPDANSTVAVGDAVATILVDEDPVNTTADEGLFITQMAVDQETGRVYFCHRPVDGDPSGITPGIVYYDPATKKFVKYGETNDLGTGIVINPNKTLLF